MHLIKSCVLPGALPCTRLPFAKFSRVAALTGSSIGRVNLDPTGAQIHLRLERDGHVVTADIAQVGALLRGLSVDGVDLIARFPQETPAPSASGTVLVPWPNRIRDAQWELEGETQQLWITEPKLNNAIHGLLRFTAYAISESDSAVTLRANVVPQSGYPFLLETAVTYALTAEGVIVTHSIRNSGEGRAPVAIGVHPFLALGDVPADQLTLTSSGAEYMEVDDRLLPTATLPVTADNDLRAGRVLSELHLDTAYASLTTSATGRIEHSLSDTAGNATVLWQDPQFGYVQFYTSRDYPGRDVAIACEPMTAPAEAFNSGTGLIWLDNDQAFTASWGVSFRAAK